MRELFVIAALAASYVHAPGGPPQPLTRHELRDFLGPVAPDAFQWRKQTFVDYELYNGEARPPLVGHVGFYVGGHPNFTPPQDSTIVRSRLGRYAVEWHRARSEKGSPFEQTLIRLDNYWYVDLRVSAKTQKDIDRITPVLSQLPVFSQPPKSPSRPHYAPHPW